MFHQRFASIATAILATALVAAGTANTGAAKVSVLSSSDRGNYISISIGKSYSKKTAIIEIGVKKKQVWKFTKLSSAKVSTTGKVTICNSRLLPASSRLRVRVSKKVISTISIRSAVQLSGCGYVPLVTTTTVLNTTVPTVNAPNSPALSPVTTTTVPIATVPTVNAPNSLALSLDSDTGDSNSDGITKATNLVIVGQAPVGSSVQVYVNGMSSGSPCITDVSGNFACFLGTVVEGAKTITARARSGGIDSILSSSYLVVVDRTAPTSVLTPASISLNSNESTTVTIQLSESSTTLVGGSVTILCTMPDGCAQSNFMGSGSAYSLTFSMVNNMANGGLVRLAPSSYSDIAGNVSVGDVYRQIYYDIDGPSATFVRTGDIITVTFHEVPYVFRTTSLYLQQYSNTGFIGELGSGVGFINFAASGSTGRSWTFTIPAQTWSDIDDSSQPVDRWAVAVGGFTDVDGNPARNEPWFIPRV